ncbi:MAG TPA: hypothetical protein VFN11_02105 [Ktedonobacterales bacterium]|nr:hypothetical protein [Ktedonobacterales bacterium]
MFPLAHAWLIERLVPAATPAHYLGCIWPDMLFGSPLSHHQSHGSGILLADAIKGLPDGPARDEFRAFVAGVLSHGSEPRGFDWYSDEQYGGRAVSERGYAFQQARPIADDAASACGVARDLGWWKAHNIVENAFERRFYLSAPHLGDSLAAACVDEPLRSRIASVLAPIFGQPAEELSGAMLRFPSVVTFAPATARPLAEKYAEQTRIKHAGSAPDVAAIERLILRAEELIAPTRDAYLADCEADVGRMIRAVLIDAE